jgi:hypothetical protein
MLEANKALQFLAKAAGYLALISLALTLILGYQALDRAGYILHHHDTPVWIEGEWMTGEFRDCQMLTTTPVVEGQSYSTTELEHLPKLFCSSTGDSFFVYGAAHQGTDTSWEGIGKDFHVLPVRYFGRLERPERWLIRWRCQRATESLSCKALT